MNNAAFPNKLRLERTGPLKAILIEEFVFISPSQGRVVIEKGFDTDYASVPRIFWNLYPPDGQYTEAAIPHDMGYWYHGIPLLDKDGNIVWGADGEPVIVPKKRVEIDIIFLEGMAAQGVPYLRRKILFNAVRLGGGGPWARAERQRLGGTEPTTPQRLAAAKFHKRK